MERTQTEIADRNSKLIPVSYSYLKQDYDIIYVRLNKIGSNRIESDCNKHYIFLQRQKLFFQQVDLLDHILIDGAR